MSAPDLFLSKLHSQLSSPSLLHSTALTYNTSPTPSTKFPYAYSLCHSPSPSERAFGIQLMDSLTDSGYEHSEDCMYGKCVAQYLNGDFAGARRTVEGILRYNQENGRAKEVWEVLRIKGEEKERMENVAIGTGVVAVGVGVVVGLVGIFMGKKR
mmetsp:Transcript_5349/g.9731  ORF Transcript_5349/g.9731 Transcript_5349/m.9731 type:complete len:155 (-) Transcript_5349:99-563(-)